MSRYDRRDLAAGVLLFLVGGAFLWGALGMRIGTARSMGAGYFPLIFSLITMAIGLVIAGLALRRAGSLELPPWRPFIAVIGSVAVFAVSIRSIGLLPAVAATVAVAAFADSRSTVIGAALLAVGLAAGGWLIFIVGLGMPIPLLRSPL